MFCPDCMGTGEAFPGVPCDRCHATGELAYTVDVTLTNEDQGYRFSEYTDTIDADTRGNLYRTLQREYGRCRSKVYIDTTHGTEHVGWYFEKRDRYDDTGTPYLRGAWCTVRGD